MGVLDMVMDILVTMARGKLSPTLLDRSLMVFLLLTLLLLAVLTMLVSSQVSPMVMVLAMAMVSMARVRLIPTPLVRWLMASLYIMPLLLDMLIMLVLLPAMDMDLGMPDMPVTSMARLPVKTKKFKN